MTWMSDRSEERICAVEGRFFEIIHLEENIEWRMQKSEENLREL